MTRAELDSATDEQLNEMAAKVMGWVVHHRNTALYYPAAYTIDTRPARVISEWSPSTDIADAKELWAVLRGQGWAICITDPHIGTLVGVSMIRRVGLSVEAVAKTEARAITTAALLAWEAKEKA